MQETTNNDQSSQEVHYHLNTHNISYTFWVCLCVLNNNLLIGAAAVCHLRFSILTFKSFQNWTPNNLQSFLNWLSYCTLTVHMKWKEMSTNRDGRDILMKVFLFVSHAIQENIHSLNLMRSINEKNLEIFHIFHPNGYYVGTTQANDHQKIITIPDYWSRFTRYPNKFCCPNSFVFPFSYSIVFLVCLVQLKAIKFFSADVIKNIFRLNATVSEVWHTKWLIHHAEIFDS